MHQSNHFPGFHIQDPVSVVLRAEGNLMGLSVAALALSRKSGVLLLFALFLLGPMRDAVVYDRRPGMHTPGQCVLYALAAILFSVPFLLLSQPAGLIVLCAVPLWAVLDALWTGCALTGQLMTRLRPKKDGVIRMKNGPLLVLLRYGVLCLTFAGLSAAIGGRFLAVLLALAGLILLAGCFSFWVRRAVVTETGVKISGLRRCFCPMEELKITQKGRTGERYHLLDARGRTIFRTTGLDEGIARAAVLRKKK